MTAAADLKDYIAGVEERCLDMAEWCDRFESALPEQVEDLRRTLQEHAASAIESGAALRRRLIARVAAHDAELAEVKAQIDKAKAADERTLAMIDREIFRVLEAHGVGKTCALETPVAKARLQWGPEYLAVDEKLVAVDCLPAECRAEKTTLAIRKTATREWLKAHPDEVIPGCTVARKRTVKWS